MARRNTLVSRRRAHGDGRYMPSQRVVMKREKTPMRIPEGVPQYFLDDELISYHEKLVRRWLPAKVFPNPVIVPDKPWEGRMLVFFGTVLEHEGGYRLYYSSASGGPGAHLMVMLAESDDGFRWRKPELGLVDWEGSRANNIVLDPGLHNDGPSLAFDPEDTKYPYKMMIFWKGDRSVLWGPDWGLHGYQSSDGLKWVPTDPHIVLQAGDRTNMMVNKPGGKFVTYTRHKDMFAHTGGRAVYRSESDDFLKWTEPQLVLAADLEDEPDVEFYGMSAFERNGHYFGLLEYWRSAIDTFEIHLVHSRDGANWTRPSPRAAFIAPTYDWNRTWSSCASNGPIIINEQMVFYVGGRWTSHHYDSAQQYGAIGYASLPLDRFCALEATVQGRLVTKPIIWPGGELVLNADCRESFDSHPADRDGEIQVEVLGPSGESASGGPDKAVFSDNTHSRCGIRDGTVRWPEGKMLDALRGRPICLRFTLKHARLFTITATG